MGNPGSFNGLPAGVRGWGFLCNNPPMPRMYALRMSLRIDSSIASFTAAAAALIGLAATGKPWLIKTAAVLGALTLLAVLPPRWWYSLAPPLAYRKFRSLRTRVANLERALERGSFDTDAFARLADELEKLNIWPPALRGEGTLQDLHPQLHYLGRCIRRDPRAGLNYLSLARRTFSKATTLDGRTFDFKRDQLQMAWDRMQKWWWRPYSLLRFGRERGDED